MDEAALPVVRILLSGAAAQALSAPIAGVLGLRRHRLMVSEDAAVGDDVDLAFISRDVTARSTKQHVLAGTQRFYDQLLAAPSLCWTHIHSAGADRPVFQTLHRRGVAVTTSSGANARVVAQTVLAGVLSLAREFPSLQQAQRERRWKPLVGGPLPRDLDGQHAVVVGWGPVGREIGALLRAVGLRVTVVRRSAEPAPCGEVFLPSLAYEHFDAALPTADWLVLACPLSARTRGLIGAPRLALLPPGARLVNVARGEVVAETALVAALREGRLAGACLDVFEQEPLDPQSPLWWLPNVMVTPHSAGHSDGNAARVARMFLDNLEHWCRGEQLAHGVA